MGEKPFSTRKYTYIMYDYDETYLEAVENHICNIIEIHKIAIKRNIEYQKQITKDFAQKVTKGAKRDYEVGETVWVDIRRQMRANQRRMMKWVGCARYVELKKDPCITSNTGQKTY